MGRRATSALNGWKLIHGGVRQGARALGLDASQRTPPMAAMPPEMRRLEPFEVEDVLCIYKDELAQHSRASR